MKNKKPLFKDSVFDKFDSLNVSSASESTGLIQVPPIDDDELENYRDISNIISFEENQPKF